MKQLDVGIIGCGTAGSTAALFLARAGHRVTIYERFTEPKPVGAGITLQPTGVAVLDRLGLADPVLSRGSRLDNLVCQAPSGRTIVTLDYDLLGPEAFGVGLHRGVLFRVLFDAVLKDGRITLRLGQTGENLRRLPEHRLVVLDEGDREIGVHDLVLVCDGARSHFRDDTKIEKRIEPYPWGALWFVAKDTRTTRDKHGSTLFQVARGTKNFLGLLPTGLGPDETNEHPLVSLFWSLRRDHEQAWREGDFGGWKDDCLSMHPTVGPILEQIHGPEDVLFSAYHDVEMYPWATRNVAYLGDAAHAMSPQLGQGCNLALFDAMTLADCIERETNLRAALDLYTRTRRDHLRFYQQATRWLTPFFQSDYTALGWMRDLGMPIAAGFGMKKLMARAMGGAMIAWDGTTFALPSRARNKAETGERRS